MSYLKRKNMKKKKLLLFALLLLAAGLASAGESAQATLKVEGKCGMCKKRIEKAALAVEGVASASWDKPTASLLLRYDASKTTPDAVSKALAQAGHDTEKDKADDKTYKALPGCCHYRE
jgi:Cu(I)/Ag(I) efflux system membrane fusion protein